MNTHAKIQTAWDYIVGNVYNPDTRLIYDHKHAADPECFPTTEEVNASYPNSCGYGVGMEDGMINGGTMIDACLCRYEKNGDEKALEFAHNLLGGMLNCIFNARTEGFVPRACTPYDGKTSYVDSSRDQYTMFVFGAHRMLYGGYCTAEEKESLKKALTAIARRAEKNVIPENDYDILRDDGGRTLVNIMWGDTLDNHEYLRLPMIYIAAWEASGDDHWMDMYKKYREEAYEKSLTMSEYWHLYALQQMQASVLVCMEADPDREWKEKYLKLMNIVADYIVGMVAKVEEDLSSYTNYNEKHVPFRKVEMTESLRIKEIGLPCMVPNRDDTEEFFILQDAANIIIVNSMAPGRETPKAAEELYWKAFDKIDFSIHERVVPIHFIEAYYRMK